MDDKNKKIWDSLTDDQKKMVDNAIVAEDVYKVVVSKLNINHDNKLLVDLAIDSLKRQTTDHIIFSIWNNLSDAQARELKDYAELAKNEKLLNSSTSLLFAYALNTPALLELVMASLSQFFKEYVAKFNRLTES